jgi:hypothetical protein
MAEEIAGAAAIVDDGDGTDDGGSAVDGDDGDARGGTALREPANGA